MGASPYDAVGRSSLLTYPDGHTRAQTYDPEGRIASRCYQYTTTTRCYGATYDAAGNPTTLSDPEGTDTLTYDGLDRLMQDARIASGLPDQIDNYTYNALGALKTNAGTLLDDQRPRLAGGGTADAAIPATLSGSPVTLNPAGNVTLLRGVTLAYNGRGQVQFLQRPITGATETEQYGYDTAGRRIGRIRSSVPTAGGPTTFEAQDLYLYEGPNVAAIYSGATTSPSLAETWLFDGVDHPLRVHTRSPDLVYYYELDLAGNVRRLMRPGGSDAGGYRYTAFGTQMPADATTPSAQFDQPLRWKGRLFTEFVPGAGLYDVRARAWSPEMGSFTSIDEYAFHDARSTLWGWPGANPARWRDPRGHDPSGGFDAMPDPGDAELQNAPTIQMMNAAGANSMAALLTGGAILVDEGLSAAVVGTVSWARSLFVGAAVSAPLVEEEIEEGGSCPLPSPSTLASYYPPNRGFLNDPTSVTLSPGTMIDRFGQATGTFAAPAGTPLEMRALPPEAVGGPYNVYEVLQPLEVKAGSSTPWFGQIGMGTQYELPASVQQLLNQGYLGPKR